MEMKQPERDTRNYGDIYSIKDFMINSIAPQYFDMDNVNQFNVGLLGYTTEIHAVTVEDTFNTMNTLMHEMFETRAQLPSTLYTQAAILDVDDYITANPATVNGTIFVKAGDITRYGSTESREEYVFVVDNDTVIEVDGMPYMFDYDIIIQAREHRGGMIYTSRFDMKFVNVISDVTHPYLKTFETNVFSESYVGVNVPLRQVSKLKHEEVMISNDNINYPVIEIEHDNMLAGMNVFYKSPAEDKYIQLEGKLLGGTPLRTPFYYYTLRDEHRVELSFTSMDRYFQPEYNAEIVVELYSTRGSKGNFKEYDGTDINVIGKSETYDYNNSTVVMFCSVTGSSKYGHDRLGLEELRTAIVEKKATSGAYNIEDDLQMYLDNYTRLDNTFVLFIKKRDDIIRLFSGFILIKNHIGDYFHTNTLDVKIPNTEFDVVSEVTNIHTLKAGKTITYDGDSLKEAKLVPDSEDLIIDPQNKNEFYYTNPFLVTYKRDPASVSYFLNSIDDYLSLDFISTDSESEFQFIANGVSVYRNAIVGEDSYNVKIRFKPTSEEITILDSGEIDIGDDKIKVVMSIEGLSGDEIVAYEMDMTSFDEDTQLFTYEVDIKTDDMITGVDRFNVQDPFVLNMGETNSEYPIPMDNFVANFNIMVKNDDFEKENKFWDMEGIRGYSIANIYGTSTEKMSFIKPMSMILSQAKYLPSEGDSDFIVNLIQVPLLSMSALSNSEDVDLFISELHYLHDYLQGIIDMKTSNYSIDLKFYNTYGRSRNFSVGEVSDTLNRTNVAAHIQIFPSIGANVEELFRDVRMYIKSYIENINKNRSANINIKGYNSVYISNLIQELENNFPEMKYMKFVSINEYKSSVQVIENKTVDSKEMTSTERREYVPEYLTIRLEDIKLDLLSR